MKIGPMQIARADFFLVDLFLSTCDPDMKFFAVRLS